MLSCNMIRSRPATSPSPRILPLSPFSHTDPPNLCLSPLRASTNSTHPTQLDTPVPPQPPCFQSYPHTFRHTWGCASVSTFHFELFTPRRCFRTCPRQRPHQCHSAPLSRPLFSYSYVLFCTKQSAISSLFFPLRTICPNHRGGGAPPSGILLIAFLKTFKHSSFPSCQHPTSRLASFAWRSRLNVLSY